MAAANTDKFRKVARRWVGQIGAGGVADDAVTTIPLASTTNLPTTTAVCIVVDRVDSAGTSTPTLEETIVGTVSGDNIVSALRAVEGTAQAHSAGAVVELLMTADNINDMIDGILTEHNQLGGHTNIAACNVTASGTVTALTHTVTGQSTLSDVTACAVTATSLNSAQATVSNVTASSITSQVASTPIKFVDAHFAPVATYTPDAAATATLDVSQAATHAITMPAGNITIAISNETAGQYFVIEITQDGTGSRTVTWFSTIKWAGGDAPTLTTTADKRDTFGFRVTGTDTYDGFVVGQDI